MRTFTPKGAILIPDEAELKFKGVIFDTYQWQQKMYDGSYSTFEMLRRPDTVDVISIKDGKLVVQEQEQPNQGFYYDFPGGRHDVETETELEAAKRETLEESGMTFATWKLIHVFQPQPKLEWFIYTFVATDFIDQVEQKLDSGEKITNSLKSLEEVKKLLKNSNNAFLRGDVLNELDSLEELVKLPDLLKQ